MDYPETDAFEDLDMGLERRCRVKLTTVHMLGYKKGDIIEVTEKQADESNPGSLVAGGRAILIDGPYEVDSNGRKIPEPIEEPEPKPKKKTAPRNKKVQQGKKNKADTPTINAPINRPGTGAATIMLPKNEG